MQVNVQYAREHLEELIASAERGEDVEIACEGKSLAKLIVMPAPLQAETKRERILGAGEGLLRVPTDEEWRQMKEEDARLMTDDEPAQRRPIFGAGRGEIILPTDEEWKAMDKELEDLMLNGPLFPATAE